MHLQIQNQNSLIGSFIDATSFHGAFAEIIRLPESLQVYLCGFLDHFESGLITLLEGDGQSIKTLHSELHQVMIDVVKNKWQVKLIDIANCFDPHLISTLCFQDDIDPRHVLQQISLARPFQIYQSASIIKQLEVQLSKNKPTQKQLIIITCISSQFFDSSIANEDPNFPLPQLDLLRHSLGILQGLAIQGHTIVMTELTETRISRQLTEGKNDCRVQDSSLAYAGKIHIRISSRQTSRRVELVNHPFLSSQMTNVQIPQKGIVVTDKQKSLEEWF
ncbi:MAG: hypothetical protein HeimC2_30670 [Candidatus Heimdallarchaeota archaeon LC_2]|nr:MAG: hypothetical protein HeimC2_30670 [Candidatus Heimdallarchaeota archaeon LC_2]